MFELDLGAYRSADSSTKSHLRSQLRRKLRSDSAFLLTGGHPALKGLPGAFVESRRFHALPDEAKFGLELRDGKAARGWVPLHTEPAYLAGTKSWVESFDLGFEKPVDGGVEDYGRPSPNRWPSDLPGFQERVYGFYLECRSLADDVFALMTDVLELPSESLTSLVTERSSSLMRLLHYPLPPLALDASNVGISTHSDFEFFTFMAQDTPGLELRRPSGEWYTAPAHPKTLIVILGDMFERLTNGEFEATQHRVPLLDHERSSVVLFCAFDPDVMVSPHERFVSDARPPRWEPVTQASHIDAQVKQAESNRM